LLRIKANRSSLSVISTVTNKGQMRWRIFSGALDARILIDFLKRLTRNAAKKIFLILDNLRVHHAKVVQQWLAENAGRSRSFICPVTRRNSIPTNYSMPISSSMFQPPCR
jgi:hypothetical protein